MHLSTLGKLARVTDVQNRAYRPGFDILRAVYADRCRAEGIDDRTIAIAYCGGTDALMPHEVTA